MQINVRTRAAGAIAHVVAFALALATTHAVAQLAPTAALAQPSPASTQRSPAPPAPAPTPPAPALTSAAPPTSGNARPWAHGVSEAEQDLALELFTAGNVEFAEQRFPQALGRYREAIRHWDHPAIRYNMAVCLINLDQLVEAKENLERSLAYGAQALDAGKYDEGLVYRKRLEAQLAYLEIACRDPATDVTLDGKLLFRSPGAARRFVLPGAHHVVATRSGFLTLSRTLALDPGKSMRYTVRPTLELTGHEIRAALELEVIAAATPGTRPPPAGSPPQAVPPAGASPPPPAPTTRPAAPPPPAPTTRPAAPPSRAPTTQPATTTAPDEGGHPK